MALRQLRIVISGGTGHIGQILARHFLEQGHDVTVISRYPRPAEWKSVHWDAYHLGGWVDSVDGSDVVINLAGRSVNCRYTDLNRRQILSSRTITTGLIGQAISEAVNPPKLWLNASTATIYRHSLDKAMDEATGEIGGNEPNVPATWGFSIDVATAWEKALFAAETTRTRRVALRSAILMSPERRGPFDLLLRLVRWGFGGSAGSGRQFVSWIHDVDFIRSIEFLIDSEEIEGVVNIASPSPLPNRKFMNCLRQAWCTSYVGLPAPAWLVPAGAFLLRTEPELLLKSRRVVPQRLLNAGFEFHFPNWRGACTDLVARWRQLQLE